MKYETIFPKKAIIGMIHLAGGEELTGCTQKTKIKIKRALEELAIFEEEGIDAAIIENYHADYLETYSAIKKLSEARSNVILGVNILPNEFDKSMGYASLHGLSFVQLDCVAGEYTSGRSGTRLEKYYAEMQEFRAKHSNLVVLGGVWPKYYQPVEGSDLENDLIEGKKRSDAIVVTGKGTGVETPLDKILEFRRVLGDYPLIIGAGVDPSNAYSQLKICDGAIVGSCLKIDNKTHNELDRYRIRDLIAVVKQVCRES